MDDIETQRAAIKAATDLTSAERDYLLAWCDEGCPTDEPTDVDYEEGNFA